MMKTASRSSIFFKKLPEFLINEEYRLGKLNTTIEEYKNLFAQVDEFYDEYQSTEVMKLYPWKGDARRFNYLNEPEPTVEG